MTSKKEIISDYYEQSYEKYLFTSNDVQAKGISWFEGQIEKFFEEDISNLDKVLELGGGQGEHLRFLRGFPAEYFSLDKRPINKLKNMEIPNLHFIAGDAEQLPFPDDIFDRVFSTCLLHHVNDPLQVMNEARRVTKPNGEIAFLLPTDPGILNSIVKATISYRKLKKVSNYPPALIYALDHQNSISKLLEIYEFAFKHDVRKKHYRPFFIPSVNLNLAVVLRVRKSI